MRSLCTLMALLGLAGPALSARGSLDAGRAPVYKKAAAQDPKQLPFSLPKGFERERGVAWDGKIGWQTPERAWLFAVALERSLGDVIRPDSPYQLSVTVVRVEKGTRTFVVEFAIQDPSGESLEQVQVEGVGPREGSVDDVLPAVAGQIVTTFQKNVLQ
ncbi:hypothetical protein [Geothrix fuzhouensis]|uniref:hypothetical protein n=1 Tax=Geothrix fuzhouensis TaxID=2966451 RepID=UPI0021498C35|nr:hypothetical protein [Geothrix fuzhouensis]